MAKFRQTIAQSGTPATSTDGDELCAYVVPFLMYSVLWPVGPHVVIKHGDDGCVYREFYLRARQVFHP